MAPSEAFKARAGSGYSEAQPAALVHLGSVRFGADLLFRVRHSQGVHPRNGRCCPCYRVSGLDSHRWIGKIAWGSTLGHRAQQTDLAQSWHARSRLSPSLHACRDLARLRIFRLEKISEYLSQKVICSNRRIGRIKQNGRYDSTKRDETRWSLAKRLSHYLEPIPKQSKYQGQSKK